MLLRAYFMLRLREGAWNTWLCQDLDAVLSAWESRSDLASSVGVLHLGFECPNAESLEDIAAAHPGRVLFTESAKYGLPRHFAAASVRVGVADELPIHLAPRGWGLATQAHSRVDTLLGSAHPRPGAAPPGSSVRLPQAFNDSWLIDFLEANPAASRLVRNAGIRDDESYFAREWCLDRGTRQALGRFRTEAFANSEPVDPCRWAWAAPPWLIDRDLLALNLTVRAQNVFHRLRLSSVRDLGRLSREALFETRNFGSKTCLDVVDALRGALEDGPPDNGVEGLPDEEEADLAIGLQPETDSIAATLVAEIRESLNSLPERDREILARRVGFDTPKATLEEIGSDHQLTRERVRQVALKATTQLLGKAGWLAELEERVKSLKVELGGPVALERAEELDPWFEDCSQYTLMIGSFLRLAFGMSLEVIEIEGAAYFAGISANVWHDAVGRAPELVRSLVEQHPSEHECRRRVGELLPESGREFAELLWGTVAASCHFSANQAGSPVLCSVGNTGEAYVRVVLERAEHPLHFTEIARRVAALWRREVDVRTMHRLAGEVGFLFSAGTYGADRHIPLTPEQLDEICRAAEDIVRNGPPGRQWRAAEILEQLIERDDFECASLDSYLVNIALWKSRTLSHVGRMLWEAPETDENSGNRVKIRQAVVSILENAGGPLEVSEIQEKVREERGLGENFQIFPDNDLIRVGRGKWGLNDRDVPVSRGDQPALLDRLAAALETRQVALHGSEVESALETGGFPIEALFSLAFRDPRLKVTRSRYVYLAEWGEPRRDSLPEAIKRVLREAASPLALRDVAIQVEERMGRAVDQVLLSSALKAVGAQYDRAGGTWSAAPAGDPEPD